MFTMCNAALGACWDTARSQYLNMTIIVSTSRLRDATELNNDGMIKLGDVFYTKQNRIYGLCPKEI